MCRGEIFFARPCAIRAQSRNHQTWPHHKSWCAPNVTTHRMCRGEIFFARLRVIHTPSSNHQTSPRPKSWHPPNVTTHRMCRGEIFFARPCAFDAPSTTRCNRAPTTRCRTTVVRAKNISPVRVPLMSDRPPFARACALGAAPPRRAP